MAKITPEVEAQLLAGGQYEEMGNHRRAEECYRKATELMPTLQSASLNLVSILCTLEDEDAAQAEADRFLALEGNNEQYRMISESYITTTGAGRMKFGG